MLYLSVIKWFEGLFLFGISHPVNIFARKVR